MKWLHNLLKGCTLTTALFIFQACYGTGPGDLESEYDSQLDFNIVSASTKKPIGNISIFTRQEKDGETWTDCGKTDSFGNATVYTHIDLHSSAPEFRFSDRNGEYQAKDTTFNYLGRHRDISIALKETKQ